MSTPAALRASRHACFRQHPYVSQSPRAFPPRPPWKKPSVGEKKSSLVRFVCLFGGWLVIGLYFSLPALSSSVAPHIPALHPPFSAQGQEPRAQKSTLGVELAALVSTTEPPVDGPAKDGAGMERQPFFPDCGGACAPHPPFGFGERTAPDFSSFKTQSQLHRAKRPPRPRPMRSAIGLSEEPR